MPSETEIQTAATYLRKLADARGAQEKAEAENLKLREMVNLLEGSLDTAVRQCVRQNWAVTRLEAARLKQRAALRSVLAFSALLPKDLMREIEQVLMELP